MVFVHWPRMDMVRSSCIGRERIGLRALATNGIWSDLRAFWSRADVLIWSDLGAFWSQADMVRSACILVTSGYGLAFGREADPG